MDARLEKHFFRKFAIFNSHSCTWQVTAHFFGSKYALLMQLLRNHEVFLKFLQNCFWHETLLFSCWARLTSSFCSCEISHKTATEIRCSLHGKYGFSVLFSLYMYKRIHVSACTSCYCAPTLAILTCILTCILLLRIHFGQVLLVYLS